jgi:hypothetical protein
VLWLSNDSIEDIYGWLCCVVSQQNGPTVDVLARIRVDIAREIREFLKGMLNLNLAYCNEMLKMIYLLNCCRNVKHVA